MRLAERITNAMLCHQMWCQVYLRVCRRQTKKCKKIVLSLRRKLPHLPVDAARTDMHWQRCEPRGNASAIGFTVRKSPWLKRVCCAILSNISFITDHVEVNGERFAYYRNRTDGPLTRAHPKSAMAQAYVNGLISPQELPPDDVVFGRSRQMAVVRSKIELAAATNVPVLLQGESGTGKEILAKLLHMRSPRSRCSWVRVMCPAIPQTLIESELFGYDRGAFTGAITTKRGRVESAHGGTLFLDEIGGLDISVQAKLLQLLQDGSFMRVGGQETLRIDTRIISSSNMDLRSQVEQGTFRVDFFYRLNAITVDLPPLRNRIGDLPQLIDYFLEDYSRSTRRTPRPLTAETLCLMRRFDWPGNIRQLENLIRGYVLIGSEDVIVAELVPRSGEELATYIDLAKPISLKQITKAATAKLEREIIHKVLEANGGSRRKTARWLNISYRSLLYKLEEAHTAEFSP